jgi:pyruvate dehydrogenase E2 component (dihydrolipoyllysine-residue acetyltransferase)
MTEITMPRLSDSMQEGTILAWLKADGEYVSLGEPLVEIETDKAAMTYAAEAAGTLQILAAEGDSLPVGAPVARLAESAQPAPSGSPERRPGPAASPAPKTAAPQAGSAAPEASEIAASEDCRHAPTGNGHRRSTRATPLARRAAELHGVRLQDIVGTGPLGRITRTDVLAKAALPATRPPAASAPAPGAPPSPEFGKGEVEVVELSRLQATVARRMAQAKATIPHFQVQTEVAIDAAMALRGQLKDTGELTPSLTDLIVKASALALRRHRTVNASYRDGNLELYSRVNVGIAVAAENALVVPTIFDADQKSLGTIAQEAHRLAERVRDGTITPPELSGATFTVSNLGMYGMTAITPVINAPQAAILGVGAAREVLAREQGEIVGRQLVTLTVSCDHRILYGAQAAQFLATIGELLQQPVRLML